MASDTVRNAPEVIVGEFRTELNKGNDWQSMPALPRIAGFACMIGIVGSAAVLGYGSAFHNLMPAPNAAFLMTVIVLTGTSFVLFVRSLEAEGKLFIESHWGGLGGGLGGWRMSRSLTYLLITIPLALLLWHCIQLYPVRTDMGYRIERYIPAIDEAQRQNIRQLVITVQGNKLHLTGIAPNVAAVDSVWNLVKQANPVYDDIELNFTIQK